METQMKLIITEELKQFHCSLLLDEVREKVRKLRAYGIEDAEIMAAMDEEEELFPQLLVSKKYEIILLSGKKRVEVKMEPIIKAVYLLFLTHPEGIVLKCLPDYREELTKIYLLLKPTELRDRARKSIMDATNPTLNSINEKCARIRKLFSEILPKSVAKYYAITGKRGEAKKIDLVRANVIWQCKLPSPQGL
ncbi:MAG: hypothetical protein IJ604_02400 [Prevotella sp.]|nr:hypothetical protein [Prevotella sp.]MBR1462218.1 hypothetical protein [Prevotella sp.]